MRNVSWLRFGSAFYIGFLAGALGSAPPGAWANPSGEHVVAGSARFDRAGKALQITTSDKAIIHWQDFSIGEGGRTRFVQPGSHSAVLNRVVSGLPSNLLGDLEANGKVFLINPNGVLIGPGARIDTAGFLASTLEVSDAQFLAGGDLDFLGSSTAGIVNRGTINAIGGDVFLIARSVENSGVINAPDGTVGLAAGQDVLLKQAGDERLFVRPGTGTKSGTGVTQSGQIAAATAELKASGNLYALAINHSGVTRATGATSKGGRVFLTANGGSIQHSGKISARKGAAGGRVQITGRDVALTGTAVVDASGEASGGEILIGGDFQGRNPDVENAQSVFVGSGVTLKADGGVTSSGAEASAIAGAHGGKVIVWSDGATEFHGSISARALGASGDGGFAEVSGKQSLGYFGLVDLRALGGQTGTLLLDPVDFTIGGLEAAAIIAALAGSNVVLSTDPSGGGNGDVFIDAPLIYSSGNSFTILAHRHIFANASVQNEQAVGGGALNLVAGWDGVTEAPGGFGIQPIAAAFNIAGIVSTPASFGNGDGSVLIGSQFQAAGIAVGSRSGTTTVAASQLYLLGSNAQIQSFAQLGFQTNLGGTGASGDISVQLQSELFAIGGSEGSYAQVGHGGSNFSGLADTAHTGVITIDATRGITDGQVLLFGGGIDAYAQIGHGGIGANGSHSGSISMASGSVTLAGGAVANAYSQIGHGGTVALGNHSGAITVASSGNLSLQAGGDAAYAQLGHGGVLAAGNHSGAVTVTAGNVTLAASDFNTGYAQLGHGGFEADGNHDGALFLIANGNVNFISADGFNSYTQFGHGGVRANGNHSGAITLFGGDLNLQCGAGSFAYSQLGHGGGLALGNHSGAISVFAAAVSLAGGAGVNAYAQLGHGGCGTSGNHSGSITLTATGDLSLTSGSGDTAYTQLGHGGCFADGAFSGDVNVSVESAFFQAGSGLNTYSLFGHGGVGSSGARSGNLRLTARQDITLAGLSAIEFAQIGNYTILGARTGSIIVAVDQLTPLVDNGGTLTMNAFSLIEAGGAPNTVSIFDNRREPNTISNGAIINGVVFDNTLAPGTLIAGRWNQNIEGVSWGREQWDPNCTLATPGPYTAPFTFCFNIGGPVPPPVIPPFEEPDADEAISPRTLSEIFDDGFFANNNGDFRNRFEPNLPGGLWWILYGGGAPQSAYLLGSGRLGSSTFSSGDAALTEDFAISGGRHWDQYRAIPRRSHSAQHRPLRPLPEAPYYEK